MGQHNTHVYNNTDKDIKIVLTDNEQRNTTQIIKAQNLICIPTTNGRVTLGVFN